MYFILHTLRLEDRKQSFSSLLANRFETSSIILMLLKKKVAQVQACCWVEIEPFQIYYSPVLSTEYPLSRLPLMLLEFVLNTLYVVSDTILLKAFLYTCPVLFTRSKYIKKTNQHSYAGYTLSGLEMEFSLIMVFLINFWLLLPLYLFWLSI